MALEIKTEAGAELENLEDLCQLSPMQLGMLFHTLESPEAGLYFEQSVFTIKGPLDVVLFERAWRTVINRHSILRSSFFWQNLDSPIQAVHRRVDVLIEKRDWGESPQAESQLLEDYLAADRNRGFDLEKAPLIRLALFRIADDVHRFVFSRHHLVLDRWSRAIVNKEVFACYEAFIRNEDPVLEEPRPYGDYISWIAAQDENAAEAYWRENLKGLTAPTIITGHEGAATEYGKRFDDERIQLSQSDADELREFARQNKLTLSTIVAGAWALLLARYSGSDDVLFGVTVSGRSAALSRIESMVGLFINTLPLRTRVPSDVTVIDWLHERQQQQQELQKYEYCSLLDIHRWSEIPAGEPLFQSLLVFENLPIASRQQRDDGGIVVQGDRSYGSATGYPLTLIAAPGTTLNFQLVYEPQRFDAEFIGRALVHLRTILKGLVAAPAQKLANVPLLTAAEESLLDQWNETQHQPEQDLCVHQLFERQAAIRPNDIAVESESKQLTYAELNARANQLARYLRTLGVGTETLVGVFLDRSVDLVVALLAIHKAGGAYVPLDPSFPAKRLSFMVEDAELQLVLTNSHLAASLPESTARLVAVDADWRLISQQSDGDVGADAKPENLAYVIYTSGSTGNPKGVQIEHRALTNFLSSVRGEPGITPHDVLLAVTTMSFDIAGLEIFLPLTTGAWLVMVSSETAADGFQLRDKIATSGATMMQATPATWSMLIDAGWGHVHGATDLKVLCGGEALSVDLARKLIERGVTLWNMYGPTETTIWSTTGRVEDAAQTVFIGRPLANTRIHILDKAGNRVPIGVAGELHIGGDGLARGYLNHPELTAERFIPDSFASTPGQRLYKTGDHARYLPDGRLEFLGRLDDQVKIRGFRIELGEIESALRAHPAVRSCVVVAREDTPGEKRVVAYIVPTTTEAVNATALREFLGEKLPAYMLPAAFVELDDLPLTPNAKVDRRALPAPDYREQAETLLASASSPLEDLLTGIWLQVLKVPHLGINDNFFELGGHSLLAVSVISRARNALNVDLKIRDLFEAPTIAGLAARVRQLRGIKPLPPLKKAARNRELPLSFAQERLWFLNQLDKASGFYNVPSAFKLTGPLDLRNLQNAFERITLRHEALRTTFSVVDGKPVQVISPAPAVRFVTSSLEGLRPEVVEAEIQRLGYEEARESFDLEHGPLLRVRVLRLSENEHIVFVTTHHIVSDGWSMGILIKELAALYEDVGLPELEFQYADYAVWQRGWLQNDQLDRQLAYWQDQLRGIPTVLDLPRDRPRPAVQTFNGARHTHQLPARSTEALKELSRREGVTLFMTVLAAFKTLLYRYTGQENIIVGTPVAGRTAAEIENLIGFFVNTLPLKTRFSRQLTFAELLADIRETALDAYANQDLPFEQLVDAMQPERDLSRTPLFQIAFAFQNAPRETFDVRGVRFERQRIENRTSKFDLTLFAMEASGNLYLTFEYNTDLYDAERIERMMGHFAILLESVVAEPDSRIAELPLLTAGEREQVLVKWNETDAADAADVCLHELFEAQAERTPTAIAIVDGKRQLTYEELEQRANQLAWRLRREGVGCESLVAVCLERSVDLVVALLGILKAGGAYVPLDPSYPQPRLRFMLEDTQAQVVITEQQLAPRLSAEGKDLWLDQEREQLAQESTARPPRVSRPESLGYVIYTSGSTGRPKGVAIEQRSTVALLQWAQSVYAAKDLAGVLASTSVCFDLSVFELFLPLSVGGTVVLAADALQLASGRWGVELSLINTVPSAMAELLRLECIPPSVRVVNLAGEPLAQTLVQQLYEQGGIERVYDLYGPTEDTTYSTFALRSAMEAATIGRPIANTQVYLLDALLQPVPIGVAGELYLGGAGLARGYLNRPELTAERFIPNPYGAAGTRLYKTGDLARYQADGQLQYLGRSDQQVKVRGYRIELGEIEAAINEHPAVRESVAVIHGDGPSESRIVAHVVLENDEQEPDDRKQTAYLSQWQSIWDETYRHDHQSTNPRFNTIGWNSSYTGEPIPEAEMREWVNGVTERILALKPRRVLEIGCGTGLILFQVAPTCSLYYGTDTSKQALRYLEEQFKPGEFDNVKLAQRTADDLSGLGPEKFDVVILNSVVQYFPSIDYLVRVLRNAVDLVSPNGAIFLGDIRCLPALRLLHTDVQIRNAPAKITLGDLQQTVVQKIALEKELVIDPAFFQALRQVLPNIGRVEIQLKRGHYENELTKYRYDVVLHLGDHETPGADVRTCRWGTDVNSIDDLRDLLRTSKPELLTVRDVPNARLNSTVKTVEALISRPSTMTIGDFRKLMNGSDAGRGIEPEDLWALEREYPYTVEVTWPESGLVDSFDVVFSAPDASFEPVSRETARDREPNWRRFANRPVHSEPARDLLPMMRGFLAERLPQHMFPWMILELSELPLTSNGKIDRAALSARAVSKSRLAATPFVPPGTPVEVSLATIWKEVLRIERVGVRDNFFELGGHSLLATQVVSRVREQMGVDLPLRSLFESPTVAQLAQEVLEVRLESEPARDMPIAHSPTTTRTLSPEEIDQLSGDEIDALLYQVLAQTDPKT